MKPQFIAVALGTLLSAGTHSLAQSQSPGDNIDIVTSELPRQLRCESVEPIPKLLRHGTKFTRAAFGAPIVSETRNDIFTGDISTWRDTILELDFNIGRVGGEFGIQRISFGTERRISIFGRTAPLTPGTGLPRLLPLKVGQSLGAVDLKAEFSTLPPATRRYNPVFKHSYIGEIGFFEVFVEGIDQDVFDFQPALNPPVGTTSRVEQVVRAFVQTTTYDEALEPGTNTYELTCTFLSLGRSKTDVTNQGPGNCQACG
ncbi:MAG: hypothetical protein HRU19_16420 [Pseudobacteriovorax sp.]|nr:hypothetical protein [Pseudobacteriovorax sp.]